jgi:hypothetical protein
MALVDCGVSSSAKKLRGKCHCKWTLQSARFSNSGETLKLWIPSQISDGLMADGKTFGYGYNSRDDTAAMQQPTIAWVRCKTMGNPEPSLFQYRSETVFDQVYNRRGRCNDYKGVGISSRCLIYSLVPMETWTRFGGWMPATTLSNA